MTIFRRNGKQILADDQHFADAATEEGAEQIWFALVNVTRAIEAFGGPVEPRPQDYKPTDYREVSDVR